MIQIYSNNRIETLRGDNVTIPFEISAGNSLDPEQYPWGPDDRLFFALMEPHQKFEDAIVKKVYTRDDLNSEGLVDIQLRGIDTEYLAPGQYYYSIKMLRYLSDSSDSEGYRELVDTVIPKTSFIIYD